MIKKSDIIISAWISLLLESHYRSQEYCYKNVLFRRDEIQIRASLMVGPNKQIRDNELLDLTVDKGNSSVRKFFLIGGKGSLEIYYRLSFPNEIENYNIKEYIIILLNNNFWDNPTTYTTIEEIQQILNEYFEVIQNYNYINQEECSEIIAKEAIWIAAATASYNEYHRTKSILQEKYYFAQYEIAKIAHSFNANNSLDTCRQMTRLDCTEREPYLISNDRKRRLCYWYEKIINHPVTQKDFIVITVNGYKCTSEIISFVKNEYTNIFLREIPINTNECSINEMENHASTLSDDSLRFIARYRGGDGVLQEERIIQQYYRDPYVSQYAKRWANGVCQLCKKPAPFINANGEPYLESHHIIPLSEGGRDSIDNVIALCPNCHRKMHILKLENDVERLLILCRQIDDDDI